MKTLETNAEERLLSCSRCGYVYYCNRKCQEDAWYGYHKWECKGYKRMLEDPDKPKLGVQFRHVARIIIKLKRGIYCK